MEQKSKITLDEMWQFIDNLMRPNQLLPDKSVLNYDEVFAIYSKLTEFDEVFRTILQINIMKKQLSEKTSKRLSLNRILN